jgi:hypothetical protein
MLAKAARIVMQTIFGDGSGQAAGVVGKLLGARTCVLSGEGMFTMVFTHKGEGKARVSFAALHPGHVLSVSRLAGRLRQGAVRRAGGGLFYDSKDFAWLTWRRWNTVKCSMHWQPWISASR